MSETPVRLARPLIGEAEREAVGRVLESGNITQGPEVDAFEAEFGGVVDSLHCVAVNSGTSALLVVLLALGIGRGDEVIVPSFTFAATANAVALAGATPVFVDIEPVTFCMDEAAARAAIGPRTAAIMPVHLFGHPADTVALGCLASNHGLALLEDAAQAHGASISGRPVGALGNAAAFSFYPTKNMTSGEGGMAVFRTTDEARRARLFRNQGMERPYDNELVGYNLRMTDLHAAIGRVQLRRLPEFTEARRHNAAVLSEGLAASDVAVPLERSGCHHVYHQYTVRTSSRDSLMARLDAAGVESRIFYPTPVHRLPAFSHGLELPETERASREVLSLPVAPHLSEADLTRVVEAVLS